MDSSLSIDDLGKTCKKINPAKLDLASPVTQTNVDTACGALKKKISGHINNGYLRI